MVILKILLFIILTIINVSNLQKVLIYETISTVWKYTLAAQL